jgi:hypothetical protein
MSSVKACQLGFLNANLVFQWQAYQCLGSLLMEARLLKTKKLQKLTA